MFWPDLHPSSTRPCDSHLPHRQQDPNAVTLGEAAEEKQSDPETGEASITYQLIFGVISPEKKMTFESTKIQLGSQQQTKILTFTEKERTMQVKSVSG